MKKITLIILLVSGALNAQVMNTFESAIISLRNNEVLEGEAKINGDAIIVFRKNKNGKRTNFTYRKVKSLEVNNEYYEFKIIAGQNPKLMKVIKEFPEIINLYGIQRVQKVRTPGPASGPTTVFTEYYYEYYVNKGSGDAVIKLGTSRPFFGNRYFKKISAVFFKDCPALIKKIQEQEFHRTRHVLEIVNYYAFECD